MDIENKRIRLVYMSNDPNPIEEGEEGIVTAVKVDPFDKDQLIISVNWDNGRSLNLIHPEDLFEVIK